MRCSNTARGQRTLLILLLSTYSCSKVFAAKKRVNIEAWTGYRERVGTTIWDGYRLSDAIHQFSEDDHCKDHPRSIVCLYRTRTKAVADMTVLVPILDSVTTKDTPGYASAVLHVRLGDGLCQRHDYSCRGNRTDVPNCWERDDDCWFDAHIPRRYTFSKSWYTEIPKKLLSYNVREVVIVGDPRHWTRTPDLRQGDYSVDTAYVQNIVEHFGKFAMSARVRQPGTPDEDFVYMCAAKVFVQGGGGLSVLISTVVRHQNGVVIVPEPEGNQ